MSSDDMQRPVMRSDDRDLAERCVDIDGEHRVVFGEIAEVRDAGSPRLLSLSYSVHNGKYHLQDSVVATSEAGCREEALYAAVNHITVNPTLEQAYMH